MFYTYFPTTTFKPMYAAVLGIPPLLVLGWQCYKWGAFSTGISFKPPPLCWEDFDSVVVRALKDLNPRWLWVYWAYTPIIALAAATLGSFYIDVSTEALSNSKNLVQAVLFGMISWAMSCFMASLGATFNISKYQQAKWEDAKAEFATTHGAHNLAETFERIAMEKATQQTNRRSIKFAAVLLGLMPACAGAYRIYFYANATWPGAITFSVASLCAFSVFMCFWGFFQWMLIVLMQEYLTLSNIAKSLSDCTQAWEASTTGLPHIPLTTAADVWKWYDLRQIFITIRFDHCYAICGMSVTVMSAFSLFFLLFSVLRVIVFNQPLFDAENTPVSLIAFQWIVSVLILLMRITNIYTQQQKHVHILDEARFHAMHNATRSESALGNAPNAVGGLIEAIQKHIKGENYCPNVMGISVKPTFFYFVLGYSATALGAIAAKNIFGEQQ
jgi:hypothetical protein